MPDKGGVKRIDEGLRLIFDELFPLRIFHQYGLEQTLIVEPQLAIRPFVLLELPLLRHCRELFYKLCNELPAYGMGKIDEQHPRVDVPIRSRRVDACRDHSEFY